MSAGSPNLIPDKKKSIKYLALAGGGAKGVAYIGAFKALEELNSKGMISFTFSNLEGISGSSVGAITAMLISCGYSLDEIEKETSSKAFIDDILLNPKTIKKDEIPGVNGKKYKNKELKYNLNPSWVKKDAGAFLINRFSLQGARFAVWTPLFNLFFGGDTKKQVSRVSPHVEVFRTDMGFYSGALARNYFDRMIRKKIALKQKSSSLANVTFEQHYDVFKTKLAITGSNFITAKNHVFSVDTTPSFPVADAIRISMSFPFFFKPMAILESDVDRIWNKSWKMSKMELQGLWVDGGFFNNLPCRAFNYDGATEKNTISFEFGPQEYYEIDAANDFLKAFFGHGLGYKGGNSHTTSSWYNNENLITLNTLPINTLDFDMFQGWNTTKREDYTKKQKDSVIKQLTPI